MERFNSFSSDQIILTKRQASMIMASMLLFCLFVFIVGFFLGKRAVIEDFSSKITKEALHDQIDFLLTTQSLQSSQESAALEPASSEVLTTYVDIDNQEAIVTVDSNFDFSANSAKDHVKQSKVAQEAVISQEKVAQTPIVANDAKQQNITDIVSSKSEEKIQTKKPQYAQLIGFGTKKSAQIFVDRLKKNNVTVILKTVISKSASGKQRVWYQAITPTYDTAQELQEQLAKVKRLEHIRDKDMKIVYVK